MWNELSAYSLEETSTPKSWWDIWVGSWWDMSSFGPDALIGVGTGLIVALIVLRSERRHAARARSLEVSNAQGAVVEKARSVLQHRIEWPSDGYDLEPGRIQLDRLVPVVEAVPSGEPLEHLPGFHYARRVVEVLEEVEGSANAVESQVNHHEWESNLLAVPAAVAGNIRRLLDYDPPLPFDWSWEWPPIDGPRPIPDEIKNGVESDMELRQFISDYIRHRRLLEAHREAFLTADGLSRADEWAALTARFSGVPHNPVKALFRTWKYNRAVKAARANAESQAYELIIAVDPMAF